MKRNLLFIILALGIITIVSAQNRGPRDWRPNVPQFNREEVKVSGELTIVQGFLAINSWSSGYLRLADPAGFSCLESGCRS